MKAIKRFGLTAALGLSVATWTPVQAGGIPVIDVSNLAQAITQVEHMLTQIEKAQEQLDRANGVRGYGNVIDTAYDTAMDVDTGAALSDLGLKRGSEYNLSDETAEVYDYGNERTAEWNARSAQALQQTQERFQKLAGLVSEVNQAEDQKDIEDLQARIQAESVLMENELAKLKMLESQAQAQQAAHEAKVRQMRVESSGSAESMQEMFGIEE
ncbi:type IV secretion system protein [Guyparkeria sp.]|uniref:type IV secretion system protein n=1 Tax=Guyparkeria sp. TaxID=2035736 RepID=UPI003970E1FB